MHPHPYALDSQSQSLTSLILSSDTPPKILSALTATLTFLQHTTPDHSRSFFSLAFPSLISKFFGFSEPSSVAWIDVQSKDPDNLGNSLYDLFAPDGVLMNLIFSVDRLSLVNYIFPVERLPAWARLIFACSTKNSQDCSILSDLVPIFRDRIMTSGGGNSLQLNVFEYYMLWFVYYPVCKGNEENAINSNNAASTLASGIKKSRKFRIENWTSPLKCFKGSAKHSGEGMNGEKCGLYMRLLYAYLKVFVPLQDRSDLSVNSPYRSSLVLNNAYSCYGRAEFLVNALVQFWLVDNDFSPISVGLCKSFGIVHPFRLMLGESPPVCGLAEVVKLFVKYLNFNYSWGVEGIEQVDQHRRWKMDSSNSFDVARLKDALLGFPCFQSVGSWNSIIQRPLYRFILRTFLFCPVETSIKNAVEVFSLWVCYLEPWKINSEDFSELDALVDKSVKKEKEEDRRSLSSFGYSSLWQGYVLSNYLFYSSMVMHFIGFAHKFLHADAEIMVQMVLKMLDILTESKELLKLIKDSDIAFHSKPVGSGKSPIQTLHKCVPSIHEQLQDWEDGLCESDVDGSFLHEDWNKDLRLFSDGEDGGQHLLQLFMLRAKAEIQAIRSNNLARNLQYVDSMKSKVGCLFRGHVVRRMSLTPERSDTHHCRSEVFKPRRAGKSNLGDIKYKGDWMKRPISENEVAWLAKLLVRISDWVNESLGLNQEHEIHSNPTCSYVEVPREDITNVGGPTEAIRTLSHSICLWLVMVGLAMVELMRKHGWRVNLRMLASKQVVMVLLIFVLLSVLRKAFGLFNRV